MSEGLRTFLFGVLPYICAASFVVGHIWRWRFDQFGWTTRSSEIYEKKLLNIASPMFHFGILMVVAGHAVGLLIPESWTHAIGISEEAYHVVATVAGSIAAVFTVVGLALLIYRRRTTRTVFVATTRMDKLMYLMLAITLGAGTFATFAEQVLGWSSGGYNYRESISPWLRSLFTFNPDLDLMVGIPPAFAIHIVSALLLFALWPFTRLVHVWSAPLAYVFRPYVVYRSRDAEQRGSREHRPGWEPSQLPQKRPGAKSRR